MQQSNPIRIVIIDDNFRENSPLVITLKEKHGDENVQIFRRPDDGVAFVLSNLSSKIVVLLDMTFGANERRGEEIFDEIRSKTSLATIIIMSANLATLSNDTLRRFINNHAFSAINSNDPVKVNLPVIENAVGQLSLRVDCALEEWILRHTPEERGKPYLTVRTGEKYSLDQILTEIRQNTELGIYLQKGILRVAVELLARQKETLKDG